MGLLIYNHNDITATFDHSFGGVATRSSDTVFVQWWQGIFVATQGDGGELASGGVGFAPPLR